MGDTPRNIGTILCYVTSYMDLDVDVHSSSSIPSWIYGSKFSLTIAVRSDNSTQECSIIRVVWILMGEMRVCT